MRLSGWQSVLKRFTDIVLSLITLVVCLPLSIVLAVLIKASGKGPILFRQERLGLHGRPFTLLKFRTMVEDAESDGPMLSNPDDPRVTGIGRFMRRHKIDEIPNFLNVLTGEMSIVGPRPERRYYVELLREKNPETDLMLTVRPGITCLGQVAFGYASDLEEMTERLGYELEYVRKASLSLDAKIMWHTIVLLLRGRKE
jgi:lipopolysaccharide/colanic/teichoic acid biosynthesis glycosyltransferase